MRKKILRKGKRPSKSLTQLYDKVTHIQADILERLQKLKSIPRVKLCSHFCTQNIFPAEFDEQINYFDQFWRSFFMNEIGKGQVKKLDAQLYNFSKKIRKIEELFRSRQELLEPYNNKGKEILPNLKIQHIYKCTVCEQQFDQAQALFSHRQTKHEKQETPLQSLRLEDSIFEQVNELMKGNNYDNE